MIEIKQGDTRHAVNAVLKNVDGNPIDLSTATVKFNMQKRYGNLVISKDAQQTENVGEVWVVFEEGDTDSAGMYKCEFNVVFQDGKRETFPNKNSIELKIESRVMA